MRQRTQSYPIFLTIRQTFKPLTSERFIGHHFLSRGALASGLLAAVAGRLQPRYEVATFARRILAERLKKCLIEDTYPSKNVPFWKLNNYASHSRLKKCLPSAKKREKWRIGFPSAWRCILKLGSCSSNPPIGYKIVPPRRSYILNPRSFPILWTFWEKIQIKQSVWSEKNVGGSDWCQGAASWRRLIHAPVWASIYPSSLFNIHQQQKNFSKMIEKESKWTWHREETYPPTTTFCVFFCHKIFIAINSVYPGATEKAKRADNKAHQRNVTKRLKSSIFLTWDWPKHLKGHRPKHLHGQHFLSI